jgi:hypothetical protein
MSPPDQQDTGAQCVVCRESIQSGAAVCIHCNNFQNWTRHVLRWTGVLTAVLALVPLWGGARALWELAFPDHKADVRSYALSCEKEGVILAVTNLGDRPGTLNGFSIVPVVDGQPAKEEALFLSRNSDVDKNGDKRVVRAGETFVLDLEQRIEDVHSDLTIPNKAWKTCEYGIAVQVNTFEGVNSSVSTKCPCPSPTAADSSL